ncbi:hypothetical protein D3C86_841460 [compost metagenome]
MTGLRGYGRIGFEEEDLQPSADDCAFNLLVGWPTCCPYPASIYGLGLRSDPFPLSISAHGR